MTHQQQQRQDDIFLAIAAEAYFNVSRQAALCLSGSNWTTRLVWPHTTLHSHAMSAAVICGVRYSTLLYEVDVLYKCELTVAGAAGAGNKQTPAQLLPCDTGTSLSGKGRIDLAAATKRSTPAPDGESPSASKQHYSPKGRLQQPSHQPAGPHEVAVQPAPAHMRLPGEGHHNLDWEAVCISAACDV